LKVDIDVTKVARKKFVDDFSNLAVEKCLLKPLAIIFNSGVVISLANDVVEAIAAEDESSKLERGRLALKRNTLQSGLKQLHRLDRHNVSGEMYACLVASRKLIDHRSYRDDRRRSL
jgi:hypothetical protein